LCAFVAQRATPRCKQIEQLFVDTLIFHTALPPCLLLDHARFDTQAPWATRTLAPPCSICARLPPWVDGNIGSVLLLSVQRKRRKRLMIRHICTLLMAGMVTAAPTVHATEAYPTRTVRLVVPYPAGGTVDTLA